jgi:nucleotide-binding universal stress UspA family protein
MYDNVLVPLDGSPVDEAILDHVARLAPIHGSRIVLLRVAQHWAAKYYGENAMPKEVEEAEEYLEEAAQRLRKAGIEVETVLGHGDPTDVIVREAEERGCDLIAMSTHGHKGFLDLLYGSVSHGVRHTVDIPVLLIRGKRD